MSSSPYQPPQVIEPERTRPDFQVIGPGKHMIWVMVGIGGSLICYGQSILSAHRGWPPSLPVGFGVFYVLSIVGVLVWQRRKLKSQPAVSRGEAIRAGLAAIPGKPARRGYLFLTPTELIFVHGPGSGIRAGEEVRYPLREILPDLYRGRSSYLLSFVNGRGERVRFRLHGSERWQREIVEAAAALPPSVAA